VVRNAFYSFHYKPDNWRAAQVRNAGAVEGNSPASDNDWETITSRGDGAIKTWINGQMQGRSCAVVLIGAGTAGRKWINYEIVHAWDNRKGVVGVYVHKLRDSDGAQSRQGNNPFDHITLGGTSNKLSSVVKAYYPPQTSSQDVYAYITNNLAGWIEEAITIRNGPA
jgi:hypothetical protein